MINDSIQFGFGWRALKTILAKHMGRTQKFDEKMNQKSRLILHQTFCEQPKIILFFFTILVYIIEIAFGSSTMHILCILVQAL